MNRPNLIEILLEANEEGELEPYSGRGMYGKECVSVSGYDPGEFIVRAHKVILDIALYAVQKNPSDYAEALRWSEDMVDELHCYRTDSMGMGSVYYWTKVEVPEILHS